MNLLPLPISRRGRVRSSVLGLAALAAVAVLVINEASHRQSVQALARLEQRGEAGTRIQALLRRLLDAQTGERGYVLTGRSAYLEPYRRAIREVDANLAWLDGYYGPDPTAHALLVELRARCAGVLDSLAPALQAYAAGRRDEVARALDDERARLETERARQLVERLGALERQRAQQESDSVLATLRISRLGVNATAAVGVLALLMVLQQTAALDAVQRRYAQALARERTQLETEVRRRTDDLTELARHLHGVREDESSRLARDLHDELGALLTSAKLDLARLRHALSDAAPEVLTRLAHLGSSIDSGIALKRRIIEDLRPSSLANLGLPAALQIQVREFAERAGVQMKTRFEPVSLSDNAEITVYRLVQEALTNIAKYAQAQRVEVALHAQGKHAQLVVIDDGCGFDPAASRRSAHGLVGMRYRVESMGGILRVRSAPGQGTRIEAELPLDGSGAAEWAPAAT